jgi:alpha-1,3-glucosyltransferase
LLESYQAYYLAGLLAVEVFGTFLHPWILQKHLPFLPLMIISAYCGAGMTWLWTRFRLQGFDHG